MSALHQPREIPLSKLVLWHGNVRKTGAGTAIEELSASIAAHGLLNPLTVAYGAKGKFAVIAGGRRLAALKALAKAGTIAKTASVACMLADDGLDAAEVSLAENVVRVAMHPADQFEAWRDLSMNGHAVPDIAARFGVAESTVKRRLALGRVSPLILEAYRHGETDLEALQAFTVTDDHAAQESMWQGLLTWQRGDARAIRHALTEGDVPTGDRRVRFVGLDGYEAAGGFVKRDLFAGEDGGFCTDIALLDRLASDKLQAVADEVKAEGWAWMDIRPSFGWDEQQAFGNAEPLPIDKALEAEYEELAALADDLAISDDPDDQKRLTGVERRIAEIDGQPETWSDDTKAHAGAVIYLSHSGEAVVERGLIRESDIHADRQAGDGDGHGNETTRNATQTEGPGSLPASLVEDLTAHKTAALRVELARAPALALAAIVHAVALPVFYGTGEPSLNCSLSIRSLERSMQDYEVCPAVMALEAERERIRDCLPGDAAALWRWCLSAVQDDLLDVLAVAAAHGVDTVETKQDRNRNGTAFGAALAETLQLDMAQWYRPTAAGYFGRISKAMILSDLEGARGAPGAPSWAKMKKAELAVLAERETGSMGWLPEPLR